MLNAPVVVRRAVARLTFDPHRARSRARHLAMQVAASLADARHRAASALERSEDAFPRPSLRLTLRQRRELRYALRRVATPALPVIGGLRALPAGAARRLAPIGTDRRLGSVLVLTFLFVAALLADAGVGVGGAAVGGPFGAGAARQARIVDLAGAEVIDQPTAAEREAGLTLAGEVDVAQGADAAGAVIEGPFLADGTLLKPVAVDTSLPNQQRTDVVVYKVKAGDTLTGIAARFHVSMMTLWWANKLSSKDELHVGQEISVPPVSGLLYTVKEGDSLESIAATTKVDAGAIREFNGLTSDTVIIGQQLMVPDGVGKPIPTPRPTPRPVYTARSTGSGSTSSGCGSCSFSGSFRWPVAGGYISQYFRYGHYGVDIADDYGTPVLAAASGKVIFAGYRQNGGGYQIWIDHGSGIGTAYYHLSGISVGAGGYVSRGQRIGAIGTSGWATGPHLHFEVWLGGIWSGYRVNPLAYL
ncbi:MAG: hypothetical protein A2X23_10130 [Chloroflexi bacterium GWC2_73_18]|nr:MAG: hypothetical protein A2X23_10130 [Chloroflexi bacterium GWC2_73_18]